MLKKIIVHIGYMKTGTTSIQNFLLAQRDALHQRGIFYPDKPNHFDLAHLHDKRGRLRTDYSFEGATPEDARAQSRQWFDDQIAACRRAKLHTAIFSSEALPRSRPIDFAALDAELRGLATEVTYLCYVRHPWAMFESVYRQRIKTGRTTFAALQAQPDLINVSPARKLAKLVDRLGRDRFDFRVFDRDQLVGGDVVCDCLSVLGLSDLAPLATGLQDNNPSPSLEALYLSDLLTQDLPYLVNGKRNPARAPMPQMSFVKVRGRPFHPLTASIEAARPNIEDELALFRDTLGITFPERAEPISVAKFDLEAARTWDESAFRDLAHLINDMSLEISALRKDRHRPLLSPLSKPDGWQVGLRKLRTLLRR